MALRIAALSVKGFRGFMNEKVFQFGNPAVLLLGENHLGKSSTLNAIEWCLFGRECEGKETDIRERVNWEVANRNLSAPEVDVKLTLRSPDGEYQVRRTLKQKSRRGAMLEELEFKAPGDMNLVGADAETQLSQLIRSSSFKDFSTTVYQHQEVIRNVLTQEPKNRNQAIDRLLGLSAYRELIGAIDSAGIPAWHKQIIATLTGLQNEVKQALQLRKGDLETKRNELRGTGVPDSDLTPEGVLRLTSGVVKLASEFAEHAGLTLTPIVNLESWRGFNSLQATVKRDIDRLRTEVPEARQQSDLFSHRAAFTNALSRWTNAKRTKDEAAERLKSSQAQIGDDTAILARLREQQSRIKSAEDQQGRASERNRLVQEGIKILLNAALPPDQMKCPLCGVGSPDLLAHLQQEWESSIKAQIAEFQGIIDIAKREEENAQKDFETNKKLQAQLHNAMLELDKVRGEVSKATGATLGEHDDPAAILSARTGEIDEQLGRLKNALAQKQEKLNAVEIELAKPRAIVELLALEDKTKTIEKIQESPEYRDLDNLRDSIAQWVSDIDQIKEAIKAASNDEAKTKVEEAGKAIDDFFRKMAAHPVANQVMLNVTADSRTGLNSYELKGPDGKDLVPILSQGDLNALALSIFLGLSTSSDESAAFGFMMLDDPSQSLGSQHKRRLADIMNEVGAKKEMVVISTMDAEFSELLRAKMMKEKTIFRFTDWDAANGPKFEEL
jgi:exonuclease SbcC